MNIELYFSVNLVTETNILKYFYFLDSNNGPAQNVRDDDEVQTILRKLEDKYADADNNELLMAVSKTKTSFDFKFRDHVKDEVERCLSLLENGNVDINRYLKMQ